MKQKEIVFVENLLKGYKALKAERLNLNNTWNMLERQKRDAVEGEFLSAQNITDMPGAPHGGYKSSRLLIPKGEEITDIENRQSFIKDRLIDVDDILTALDNSLDSLPQRQREVIVYFYFERYSLNQIAHKMFIHPVNISQIKFKGLEYLYKSLSMLEGTVIFK